MDDLLTIDGSNISEVAKFTSSDINDCYISLNPNNDIRNGGIIGATSNSVYIGKKVNNEIIKIINVENGNIECNGNIICNNTSTFNIINTSNINTNILKLEGWNNLLNSYNGIKYINPYILNLKIENNQIINGSNIIVNLKSISEVYNYNNNTNIFTTPINGIYGINLILNTNNNNAIYWINKSLNITDIYNNRIGVQTNNNAISITTQLNKNEMIAFYISTETETIISNSSIASILLIQELL